MRSYRICVFCAKTWIFHFDSDLTLVRLLWDPRTFGLSRIRDSSTGSETVFKLKSSVNCRLIELIDQVASVRSGTYDTFASLFIWFCLWSGLSFVIFDLARPNTKHIHHHNISLDERVCNSIIALFVWRTSR